MPPLPPESHTRKTVGRPHRQRNVLERLEELNAFVRLLQPAGTVPDDDFLRKTVGRPRRR